MHINYRKRPQDNGLIPGDILKVRKSKISPRMDATRGYTDIEVRRDGKCLEVMDRFDIYLEDFVELFSFFNTYELREVKDRQPEEEEEGKWTVYLVI